MARKVTIKISRKGAEELVDLEDKHNLVINRKKSREERIREKMKPLPALFG